MLAPLFAVIFAASLFSAAQTAAQADYAETAKQPFALNDAVSRIISELAEQKEFAAWKKAARTIYPLGAGLHGWVVLVQADGKAAGYLVITASPADERHFILSEYGFGEFPLYSKATLYRALRDGELLPPQESAAEFREDISFAATSVYPNALHAVWRVSFRARHTGGETVYVDAKTGEIYPQEAEAVEKLANKESKPPGVPVAAKFVQAVSLPEFDPYENIGWVVDEPANIASMRDLLEMLQSKQKLTYVAKLFQEEVVMPYAVTGYHTWDEGEAFIRLDQDGPRYIPFSVLARWGKFYETAERSIETFAPPKPPGPDGQSDRKQAEPV
ncbi:MAG TPA: hypothetical protein VF260_05545 [Bacilli bacterium]